jgi:DNA-binding NtrC family response regulator
MTPRRQLLVIDDDRFFCRLVRDELGRSGLEVAAEHTLAGGREAARNLLPEVVLLDNQLPDGGGLSLVPELLRVNDETKVILITGFPSFDNAVDALRDGVHDYLTKPVDLAELRLAVRGALRVHELERTEQVERRRSAEERKGAALVGASPAWRQVEELLHRFSAAGSPVLLTGESGTGKSLLARALHYASPRSGGPFLAANCAALPEGLIEAELFGAEKGAYTGAVASRKGLFEIADGGSLFLDEIAEMPLPLQAKLLSVLEDGHVRRLGSTACHQVATRVLAATNLVPEEAVASGRLRRDLFYRLNVLRIHVPPLRERPEDVPLLCRHLLEKLAPGRGARLGAGEDRLLAHYPWPGNVRELKNILERCLMLQDGAEVHPSRLLEPCAHPGGLPASGGEAAGEPELLPLEELERRHILRGLEACGSNLTRTAQVLGISLSTLRRKLKPPLHSGESF